MGWYAHVSHDASSAVIGLSFTPSGVATACASGNCRELTSSHYRVFVCQSPARACRCWHNLLTLRAALIFIVQRTQSHFVGCLKGVRTSRQRGKPTP
eukprot:s419_g2.t1